MTRALLEAFDLVSNADQLARRLEGAATELQKRPGLKEEKAWLEVARQRVATANERVASDLVIRALRLPDLDAVRDEYGRLLQNLAVDALERVHAAITFAATARSPLLEALYLKVKVPALRKCSRAELETFWTDFQTRLASRYAKRMLADESYAVVLAPIEELRRAIDTWAGVLSPKPLEESEAATLREELDTAATHLEVPFRQARLLAHAALVPVKDLLDSSGLQQKAKRRNKNEPEDGEHPLLERDPPDPSLPTPEEAAELMA